VHPIDETFDFREAETISCVAECLVAVPSFYFSEDFQFFCLRARTRPQQKTGNPPESRMKVQPNICCHTEMSHAIGNRTFRQLGATGAVPKLGHGKTMDMTCASSCRRVGDRPLRESIQGHRSFMPFKARKLQPSTINRAWHR